jgi:hypothetical protein
MFHAAAEIANTPKSSVRVAIVVPMLVIRITRDPSGN